MTKLAPTCSTYTAIIPIGALLAALSAPASAQVVNLNSLTNSTSNPVSVLLGAGNFQIFDVGAGEVAGATYDAWNRWGGAVTGCNAGGGNCVRGWHRMWQFDYGTGNIASGNTGLYATRGLALAASKANDPYTFSLGTAATVKFWIQDDLYQDNIGGVSLNIVAAPSLPAVPEPETYAMLLAGLGLLGFTARRRKNSAA